MKNKTLESAIKLFKEKKLDKAKKKILRHLQHKPKDIDALNLLASIYQEEGNREEAKATYKQALDLDKNTKTTYAIYYNLSLVYFKENQYKKARKILHKALSYNDKDPMLWMGLGNCYLEDNLFEKAQQAYEKSLSLGVTSYRIYFNFAKLYMRTNQFKHAKEMFEQALKLVPEHPDVLLEYAFLYLKLKVYKPGFELYRARYAEGKEEKQAHLVSQKNLLERGTLIRGKKILISYEQGFGDIIQFARYINLYVEMGAHVLLQVKSLLYELLKINFPMITHVKEGEFIAYDYHIPIMDSAYFFATEYETIPFQEGYLRVDLQDSQKIEEKYFQNNTKKRIGIVWRTNPAKDESFKKSQERKSRNIPLELMIEYFKQQDVQLYSMQVAVTDKERILLEKNNIPSLGDNLVSFYDNALIIDNLDMLIAIDTVSTILAGAMGKEAIVILSGNADWRWGLQDSHTNWFKTITIFRKTLEGSWHEPLASITQEKQRFRAVTTTTRTLNKAIIYHKQNKLIEAKTLYETVIAQDPDNYLPFYKLGLLLHQAHYDKEALTLLSQAAQLNAGDKEILFTLQEIVQSLKLTPFEKQYLAVEPKEFTIQLFSIRTTLPQLSEYEYTLVTKLQEKASSIAYDTILYDTLQLYIALLQNNFSQGLKNFLAYNQNPEIILEKFSILYNVTTNLQGFFLTPEETTLIAHAFKEIFQDDTLDFSLKIRFIPLFHNLYLYDRNSGFSSSLVEITQVYQTAINNGVQLQTLLILFDMINFVYWGVTQDISSLQECDKLMIQPLSQHIRATCKKNKIKKRTQLSTHKRKRVCYLGHKTSYSGAYAVGRVMYSLFRGHYENNHDNFDYYYYAYGDVDESFLQEIRNFGFTVRRFDTIHNTEEKLQTMRQTFFDDAIDITISEMPWSTPTYLFESRVSPIQIYFSLGWHYYSIENLEQLVIPADATTHLQPFGKKAKNITARFYKPFLTPAIDAKQLQSTKEKYPKDVIILGSIQRLIKITPQYLEAVKTILQAHENTIMIIAGPGNTSEIEAFIKTNQLTKRVFLPGFVDPHIYAHIFDIYLDTFYFPGGHSVLEVMAQNKPALTLFDAQWDGVLASRIKTLISYTVEEYITLAHQLIEDKAFYQQCVEATQKKVASLTNIKEMANDFETIFQELIIKKQGAK